MNIDREGLFRYIDVRGDTIRALPNPYPKPGASVFETVATDMGVKRTAWAMAENSRITFTACSTDRKIRFLKRNPQPMHPKDKP